MRAAIASRASRINYNKRAPMPGCFPVRRVEEKVRDGALPGPTVIVELSTPCMVPAHLWRHPKT